MAKRTRSTFGVNDLKIMVNERLKNSTCSPQERLAMASVLESVLHITGNYHGYQYINPYPRTEEEKKMFDYSRRYYL